MFEYGNIARRHFHNANLDTVYIDRKKRTHKSACRRHSDGPTAKYIVDQLPKINGCITFNFRRWRKYYRSIVNDVLAVNGTLYARNQSLSLARLTSSPLQLHHCGIETVAKSKVHTNIDDKLALGKIARVPLTQYRNCAEVAGSWCNFDEIRRSILHGNFSFPGFPEFRIVGRKSRYLSGRGRWICEWGRDAFFLSKNTLPGTCENSRRVLSSDR